MTIIFFTSLVLISLFLILKYWEVKTDKKVLSSVRTSADVFIENQVHKKVSEIPYVIQNSRSLLKVFVIGVLHAAVVFALSIVRFIEGHLASAVDGIRGRHGVQRHHSVSPFLKKMGEEDKN